MASESTDRRSVALDLPATLDEWLTERAGEMGVDREELIVQLVSSYQVASESENGETVDAFESTLEEGAVDVDSVVAEAIDDAIPDDRDIDEQVDQRIDGRLEALEAEIEEKLDDIRRRVVQVKQAADSKAPADHDHDELKRVDEFERQLSGLRDQVAELEEVVSAEGEASDVRSDLEDVQAKLTQLARIVVQLRDEANEETGRALDGIKRTAAQKGFEKADCGACGESVTLSLLTEASCPHCENPIRDVVQGSGGVFGSSPRLTGPNTTGGDADETPAAAEAGNDE